MILLYLYECLTTYRRFGCLFNIKLSRWLHAKQTTNLSINTNLKQTKYQISISIIDFYNYLLLIEIELVTDFYNCLSLI